MPTKNYKGKGGRPSPHSPLKPVISQKFLEGYSLPAIGDFFKEVPRSTLELWRKELVNSGQLVEVEEEDLDKIPKNVAYIFKNKVVNGKVPDISAEDSMPDLLWAKSACKEIFAVSDHDMIRLRAIDVFLKAVAIQAQKPELAEYKSKDKVVEMDYRQLSEEELGRLYRERIG